MKNNPSEQGNEKDVSEEEQLMPLNKLILRYIFIVAIHLFFILVFGYLISPLSKVDTISVEGNQDVYVQEIIDGSGLARGESVLKAKQKFAEIEKNILAELPQISSAELVINEMNKVVIQVNEFKTVAYIAEEGSYLRVLENGHVLDNLYTISIGNQLVLSKFKEGEALNLMIEELKKVEDPILNLISEIELTKTETNPLFVQIYMNNGNRILSNIPEFSEKILYYPKMVQAVEGKKGVFDMEAGIYFTPFIDGESEDSGINMSAGQELDDFDE